MAFDCTYVSSGLAQLELHDRRGMAGGIWLPDNTENTFLELDEKLDISTCRKATTMIDFLLWDAGATKKCPISACAVPVEHNFAGAFGSMRGNMYMCNLVGQVIQQSDGIIGGIICDAHGTHSYIRKLLHGQTDSLPMLDIQELPFWGELSFQDLPVHNLPRLPVKLCLHQNEVLWGIPGVCAWASSDAFLQFVVCSV